MCPRLCVCLRAALRAGPEAPEKCLLKKWPWRLCGCSQELWDGQSQSHPFTSPGFSRTQLVDIGDVSNKIPDVLCLPSRNAGRAQR